MSRNILTLSKPLVMTMVTGKPLMLKEYLELDDDEDEPVLTASASIPGAATIRCLLDAELRSSSGRVVHKPRSSKTALMMLSAAVKLLSFPSSANGRCLPLPSRPDEAHSKSFSVRLKGSLWKRKGGERSVPQPAAEEQSATRVQDIIRIRSFDANGEDWRSLRLPSPVGSSRSSWSVTDESSVSDFLPPSMASYEFADDIGASSGGRRKDAMLLNQNENENPKPKHQSERRTDDEESEEAITRVPAKELGSTVSTGEPTECNSEEEQLSPVSVIDYPYQQSHCDDDYNNDSVDEDSVATASPTFYRSLDSIERTKELLLLRIRRFEKLAELDPIDLHQRSPSSEADDQRLSTDSVAPSDDEEDERARDLLSKLKTCPPRGSMEKLLVDFFIQGQDRVGDANRDHRMRWGHTRTPNAHRRTAMLNAARDWIDGRPCTELDDFHGEATLTEMEKNGRFRCFHEEEEELALQFESALLESFVEELAQDLESRY